MVILVSGSRTFENSTFFNKMMRDAVAIIQYVYVVGRNDIELVHGNGVDTLADKFAKQNNIKVKPFDAKWNDWKSLPTHKVYIKHDLKYGDYNAMAGMNRNYEMFEYAGRNNGVLVAFWQNKSKGTKNMIDIAKRGNMPRLIYNIDKNGFDYKLERIGI